MHPTNMNTCIDRVHSNVNFESSILKMSLYFKDFQLVKSKPIRYNGPGNRRLTNDVCYYS